MQQQGGTLTGGETLQGGNEGQADLLPADQFILRVAGTRQLRVADWLDARRRRSASRQTLVAMRCSQAPNGPEPS